MRITLVTTMRNEAPHLLEWIAHHRALGVTDFLVFSNGCADGTDAMLDILDDHGLVCHVAQDEGKKPPQWRALRAAWSHPLVEASDWLGVMDCDEFIRLPPAFASVPELIEQVQADAILMRWRLFGHAGQVATSQALTLERFTRAAEDSVMFPPQACYFKTLFRKDGPFRQFGVHRPRQRDAGRHGVPVWSDGAAQLSGDLPRNDVRILDWGRARDPNAVQLNHYSLRSVSEFLLKRDRGLPNHKRKDVGLSYWVERNFNAQEDLSIARHLPNLIPVLTELKTLPGLSEAEAAGRDWHATRLEQLLADPEVLKLFGQLILASASTSPAPDLARDLVRRYGAVRND